MHVRFCLFVIFFKELSLCCLARCPQIQHCAGLHMGRVSILHEKACVFEERPADLSGIYVPVCTLLLLSKPYEYFARQTEPVRAGVVRDSLRMDIIGNGERSQISLIFLNAHSCVVCPFMMFACRC